MRLEPQETFTIARQIGRHTDTSTYYLQAVIRNSRTDEVLDTVNLEDQGNQRFTQDWQVPADPSGQGFYIDITTSVYTDSSYNNKSPNYADETETYLVQRRYNPNLGGGGGYNFTPDEVRGIIKEEVQKALTGQDKVDITPVSQRLKALMDRVEGMDQFQDVKGELQAIRSEVQSLSSPNDYSSRLASIEQAIKDLPEPQKNKSEIKKNRKQILDKLASAKDEEKSELKTIIEQLENLEDLIQETKGIASGKNYRETVERMDQAVKQFKKQLPEYRRKANKNRANNLVR